VTCTDCPDLGKSKRKTCCRRAGGPFKVGDTVPLEPRKLDIRPAFTGSGKTSFKPARHAKRPPGK
jgi:hypothetical protein